MVQREIGERGGDLTDVDHIASGGVERAREDVTEPARAGADIPAEGEGFPALPADVSADGLADFFDHVGEKVGLHKTAYIVLSENLGIHSFSC